MNFKSTHSISSTIYTKNEIQRCFQTIRARYENQITANKCCIFQTNIAQYENQITTNNYSIFQTIRAQYENQITENNY